MTVKKIKKGLVSLLNFYAREFIPSSKLYFDRQFNKTYSQIAFTKNDLIFNNEFNIKFNNLAVSYPFIEDLVYLRFKSNDYIEFKSLSYLIIDDYYKRIEKNNTLYPLASTNQKNTSFAKNIVNDLRIDFYLKIETIYYYIEKIYSIQIIEKHVSSNSFIKKEKEILNSLISNNILGKNKKWNHNRSNRKKKYIPILICKLKSIGLIDFPTYKEFHYIFEEFIGIKFDYNKATSTFDLYKDGVFSDEDSEEFFNKLSFLDSIT